MTRTFGKTFLDLLQGPTSLMMLLEFNDNLKYNNRFSRFVNQCLSTRCCRYETE